MPQRIDVPGQGVVEFPDDMTDGQIVSAIRSNQRAANQEQMADLRAGGARADQAVKLLAGAEDFADAVNHPITTTGRGINAAGNLAAGAASDLMETVSGRPVSELPSALMDVASGSQWGEHRNSQAANEGAHVLPLEADLQKEKGLAPAIATGGIAAVRTLPAVALMTAMPASSAMLNPALVMGAQTFAASEGDPVQTAKSVTLGLAMGPLGKFASQTTARVMGKAVEMGIKGASSPLIQKTVETAAHQVALNALFVAADAPEYLKAYEEDPEKAKNMLASTIGANLALGLPQILGIPNRKIPSETQKHFETKARELVDAFHETIATGLKEAQKRASEEPVPETPAAEVKPEPAKEVGAVTVRAADGTEKQTVLTDAENYIETVKEAQKVAGPNDQVKLENPVEVIAERLAEPEPVQTSGAKRKGGSFTKWYPRGDGVPDVLDAIHELGGIASPSQTKHAKKGDYDGFVESFQGVAGRLQRKQGGNMPDDLRDQLFNYGYNFESTSEMYDAIAKAVAERKGAAKQNSAEKKAVEELEQQVDGFEDIALRNKGRSAADKKQTKPVSAGGLSVGDEFTLKGEKVTVTEYDPDTDVYTVEDGRTFGRQQLHADTEFFPDKGSLKQAKPDPESETVAFSMASGGGKMESVSKKEPVIGPNTDPDLFVKLMAKRDDLIGTLKTPEGWRVKDIQTSNWHSVYWMVENPEGEAIKIRIADHQSKKTVHGPNNYEAEVPKEYTLGQFKQAMEGAERWLRGLAGDENANTGVEAGVAGIKTRLESEADKSNVSDLQTGKGSALTDSNQPQPSPNVKTLEARTPSPGPTPPGPKGAPMPPLKRGTSVTVATVGPIRTWVNSQLRPLQNLFAPHSIDPHARVVGNMIREYAGKSAVDLARADEAMAEFKRDFDRTPVRKDWKYDPAEPLPRNYQFLDNAERNRAALSPEHTQLVDLIDKLFEGRIKEVRRLQPKAMRDLIENYFPHIWKDPNRAVDYTASVVGKSPMHGDKSFLKQRSIPYILDGLKRGLEPVSDNPIDLMLMKLHQMDKFILAERTLNEMSRRGYRVYYPSGTKIPRGWVVPKDKAFTRHGPPVVTVKEAYDAGIRKGLVDFMQKMGFNHERTSKLPLNVWGQYEMGAGNIKSKFAGYDAVIMHEVGHGIDERYGVVKILNQTKLMQQELEMLAKFRHQGVKSTQKFRDYVQLKEEQVANAFQAYIYAPEMMQQVAPTVKTRLTAFINSHPELHDLNDIKPSLTMMVGEGEVALPGFVVMGRYAMPEGPAQVLDNYLSPGLSRFALYRNIRAGSNILNAAQLGLSAFHLGFTSLDAAVSSVAVGLQELLTFKPKQMAGGVERLVTSPAAPVSNYYLGKAVQKAMLEPGSKSMKVLGFKYDLSAGKATEASKLGELAVTAGLRATIDPFYQTEFTRKMVRAFNRGEYANSILHLPLVIVEQSMRPIAEFLVPRQKLGVFAQMARMEMERLGPGADHLQVREAMAKAADSTENRMGQMTYDNMFYNRIVKDLALIGFRAYGWQLGKYRESIGAAVDTVNQVKNMAQGKRPELTHRMAYAVALPMVVGAMGGIVNYLMTGQMPQSSMDYFLPRSGQTDKDGRPQRLMLPSYLKDLMSDWHAFPDLAKMGESVYHKLNPWVAIVVDMLRNRDFYDTEIRQPDDPAWKQSMDVAAYALKAARPFSVSGAMEMHEQGGRPTDYVLPFFGIVTAKKSLVMSPAEAKAADLMADMLPAGSRTKQQFDHSQLVKSLVRDMKNDPAKGATNLQTAIGAGQVKEADAQRMVSMLAMKPLQYQVHKFTVDNAMKVWDLATPEERAQIKGIIAAKLATAKDLDPETRARYLALVFGAKPGAPPVALPTNPKPVN